MFDSHYDYHFVKNESAQQIAGHSFSTSLYRFKGLDANGGLQVFLIIVEKYACETYVVKFCRKADRHTDNAFTRLTRTPDASRKVATCIKVMLDIYWDNPLASFGWIGAQATQETSKANTKRFQVWSRVMRWVFSDEEFDHYDYVDKSAYLMHNVKAADSYSIQHVEQIFKDVYPALD